MAGTEKTMTELIAEVERLRAEVAALKQAEAGHERAEEALRESEARFRDVALSSSDWVWEVDSRGRYTYCSERVVDVLGYTAEEILGQTPFDLMPPDEAARVGEIFEEIARNRAAIVDLENWNIRRDGRAVCLLTNGVPMFDRDGNFTGYRGVDKDITERVQAEGALEKSEALFRSLIESLPQNIFSKDLEGRFIFANNRYCMTEDKPLPDIIGKTDFDLHPPQLAEKYREDDRRVVETGQIFETVEEHQVIGGESFYVQVIKAPVYDAQGQATGVLGIFWDITERKQAEEALRRERDRAQQYLDVAEVMLLALNPQGEIILINRRGCRLLGYEESELLGLAWVETFVPEQVRQEVQDILARLMAGEVGPVEYYENAVVTRSGEERLIAWHNALLTDEAGEVVGVLSSGEDITASKEAEQTLRHRAVQLALLNKVTREIAAVLELDQVLDRAARLIQKSFDYEHVGTFLLDRERGVLAMRARAGSYAARFPADHHLKVGQGMVGWVASHGRTLLANDVNAESRYVNPFPDEVIRAELSVPIRLGEEVLGVLDVQSQQADAFDEDDVLVIETLADQLALAIHNARLYEQARQEIAERRQMEAALRESEERFRLLAENSPDIIYILDLERRKAVYFNRDEFLGYDASEIYRSGSLLGYLHPDDKTTVLRHWEQLVRGELGDFSAIEYRLLNKQGRWEWIQSRETILARGPQGSPVQILFNLTVVTERKQAELELRKLSRAVEQSPASVVITGTDGNIEYVNPKFTKVTGYTLQEVLGQNPRLLKSGRTPPEVYEQLWATITAGGEWRGEFCNRKKDGELFWELASISPIKDEQGRITHYLAVKEDITGRKQIEEALQHEKMLVDALLETTEDSIYFKDRQSRLVRVNRKMLSGSGLDDVSQALGKTDIDLFGEEFGRQTLGEEQRIMATGEPVVSRIERRQLPDGSVNWTSSTKVPLRDPSGQIVGLAGITREINDLKRVEEALRESESRYRGLFEDSPISLWEEDFSEVKRFIDELRASGVSDFRAYFEEHPEAVRQCAALIEILDVNRTTLELYGARDKEALLARLPVILGEESFDSFREELIAFAEGQTHFECEKVERTLTGRAMSIFLKVSIAPGYEDMWARVLVSVLDITERKRAEQQRFALAVERERVAILADFIEAASHEFATPLAVINSDLYLLGKADSPAQRAKRLASLQNQVAYVGDLVAGMFKMANLDSGAEFDFAPLDVNALLRDVEADIRPQAEGKHLAFTLSLARGLPIVTADAQEIRLVLTHLLQNALDHTREGAITVRTSGRDGHIVIEVQDTGVGIGEADLPHIFERFYRVDRARSTRGAGLGLPIARKIVEAHQGRIEVESAPGAGSIFRVVLPVGDGA